MANYSNLNPLFAARISAAIADAEAATGSRAVIRSAVRSYSDQTKAWNRYQSGKGGIAAPPGKSLHEQGMAFDFDEGPVRDWIQAHAAKYGLEAATASDRKKGTWGRDPPHIQLARGTLKTAYDTTPNAFADGAQETSPAVAAANSMASGQPAQGKPQSLGMGRGRIHSGPAVRNLQSQLAEAGFNPGKIDGVYGTKTAAAVRKYEQATGQTVDGVAGPRVQGTLTTQDITSTFQPGLAPPGGPAYDAPSPQSIAFAGPSAPWDKSSGIPPMSFAPPPMGPGLPAGAQTALEGLPQENAVLSGDKTGNPPTASPLPYDSASPITDTQYAPGGPVTGYARAPVGRWAPASGEDITSPEAAADTRFSTPSDFGSGSGEGLLKLAATMGSMVPSDLRGTPKQPFPTATPQPQTYPDPNFGNDLARAFGFGPPSAGAAPEQRRPVYPTPGAPVPPAVSEPYGVPSDIMPYTPVDQQQGYYPSPTGGLGGMPEYTSAAVDPGFDPGAYGALASKALDPRMVQIIQSMPKPMSTPPMGFADKPFMAAPGPIPQGERNVDYSLPDRYYDTEQYYNPGYSPKDVNPTYENLWKQEERSFPPVVSAAPGFMPSAPLSFSGSGGDNELRGGGWGDSINGAFDAIGSGIAADYPGYAAAAMAPVAGGPPAASATEFHPGGYKMHAAGDEDGQGYIPGITFMPGGVSDYMQGQPDAWSDTSSQMPSSSPALTPPAPVSSVRQVLNHLAQGQPSNGQAYASLGGGANNPLYGATSLPYAQIGGTPWGSNAYVTPGGSYSNSPYTPVGYNAPNFSSGSGGATYAYQPNGYGGGTYVDSHGNVHSY